MTNSTWADDFLHQLDTAWHTQAYEQIDDAQRAVDAVAGFMLAVDLAAATTNDRILDVVSKHLAVTTGTGEHRDISDLLHAAILNVSVTFLKPALDALQGSGHDVRHVAQQMAAVISSTADEVA